MANDSLKPTRLLRRMLLCARLHVPALVSALVCVASPAHAQSAADKATARKLATAGIKLYQQGQYDEALDKLKRAQAMYDAPVHLLYMARSQVKLGQLVEGTESYRRLVRAELDSKAPEVFRQAVADGEKELAEVEPRIPSLTINVEPSSAADLKISLDGESVSAAVLGVERPVNPGDRAVVVEAPGFLDAKASVTLSEGESRVIMLTLEQDPNPPAAAEPPLVEKTEPAKPPAAPDKADESWRTEEVPAEAVGFFLGIRGGALFPSGSMEEGQSTTDFMTIGGGGELHGGVRFLRNFGVKLFFERYSLLPGDELNAAPEGLDAAHEVTSLAHSTSFGVSGTAGTQRGRIGGYGELGIALVHQYGWDREIVDTDSAKLPNFDPCTETVAYKGAAFRIGGAFVFPVHKNFQLTAVAVATMGNFNTRQRSIDCRGLPEAPGETETDITDTALHQQFFIGAGADFVFGPG